MLNIGEDVMDDLQMDEKLTQLRRCRHTMDTLDRKSVV